MVTLNTIRHLQVFDPDKFGNTRVDVIGLGATGSRIVLSLAKLGIRNIHVWDYDVVEEHNVPNQVYGINHVDKLKGEALKQIVFEETKATINFHNEKVDGSQPLGEIIFLLTDTMSSRKQIWKSGIKYKFHTQLLIETRMGADSARIYAVSPSKPSHIRAYEETFYNDEEAEISACGASTSVGPTAEIISGLAVWQLIRWFDVQNGGQEKISDLDNEIIFSLRPMLSISRKFTI